MIFLIYDGEEKHCYECDVLKFTTLYHGLTETTEGHIRLLFNSYPNILGKFALYDIHFNFNLHDNKKPYPFRFFKNCFVEYRSKEIDKEEYLFGIHYHDFIRIYNKKEINEYKLKYKIKLGEFNIVR